MRDYLRRVLSRDLGAYLRAHEGLREEEADYQEQDIAARLEHHAADCDAAGVCRVLLPQRAAHQRVYADAEADRERDQQILHRERERDSRQRVLAYPGHKYAVHDIVQRLDQHRDHHRHRHGQQQLIDGHYAHFVFRLECFFQNLITFA